MTQFCNYLVLEYIFYFINIGKKIRKLNFATKLFLCTYNFGFFLPSINTLKGQGYYTLKDHGHYPLKCQGHYNLKGQGYHTLKGQGYYTR